MRTKQRGLAILLCMFFLLSNTLMSFASINSSLAPEITGDIALKKVKMEKSLMESMVETEEVVPGKLIVKFSDNSVILQNKTINSLNVVKSFENVDTNGVTMMNLSKDANMAETIETLSNYPGIEYVEPLYIYKANEEISGSLQTVTQAVYGPNDTYYQKKWQWGLQAINLQDSWDRVSVEERSSVTIAVIDTGVDAEHPDLGPSLITGYDFVNKDSNPDDDNSHGTHVAGIAAGISQNEAGIAGVAGGAKIMPVKVLNASGIGNSLNIYLGIVYAVKHGADVINLSLGSGVPSILIKEAIEFALQNDVVVVASTGNDYAGAVSYPAAFDGVIAVGAVDWNYDQKFIKVSFSNYGEKIDLVAPGVDIISTVPLELDIFDGVQDGYALKQGTSMASPFVTGMAALLRAHDSALTYSQIQQALMDNAVDIGVPGWDEFFGMGIINGSNTGEVPNIIELPNIILTGHMPDDDTVLLELKVQRGKGIVDDSFDGEIVINIDQYLSAANDGYLINYKELEADQFQLKKMDSPVQETVSAGQIVFNVENGICSQAVDFTNSGYYSFSIDAEEELGNYLLIDDEYLHYVNNGDVSISGSITLSEPFDEDIDVFVYGLTEYYSDLLTYQIEYPVQLTIPAGQLTVPYSMNLPRDKNYKVYYAVMTDNDRYYYHGFYKATGTTVDPADYTKIDLTAGSKTNINLTIGQATDQPDDVSDTTANAQEISLVGLQAGYARAGSFELEYKGDRDYFTFEVQNAGVYFFYTYDFNIRGTLYNVEKELITSEVYSIYTQLMPGTYYLKVEGESSVDTGDYALVFGPYGEIEDEIVAFPDENLNEALHTLLGKPISQPIKESELIGIEQLNLNDMDIASIEGLEYITDLWCLQLKGNDVIDIAPLGMLSELEVLDLSENIISNINPLRDLQYLAELDVSKNNISSLPLDFSGLETLYHLDLSHNHISSIPSITTLPVIETLFLQENEIASILPLSGMDYLKVLYLDGNPVTDFSPVRTYYTSLRDKDFSAPPIAQGVTITGNSTVGSTLTGLYTYFSMNDGLEGGTTFKWLRSGASNGVYTEIPGATATTYTLVDGDLYQYIKFQVIPGSTQEPATGSAVNSTAFGPISQSSSGGNDGGGGGGGNDGGGGAGAPIQPLPFKPISPTPTPTPNLTPTPSPMPVNRIETDLNGKRNLIVDAASQQISWNKPPIIDATAWYSVDGIAINLPASFFAASLEHNQSFTVRSNLFSLEFHPGTLNLPAGTEFVTLTAKFIEVEDLPSEMRPNGAAGTSIVFDFELSLNGSLITTFSKPISITLRLDLNRITSVDKVGIWYFSKKDGQWVFVGGKVNTDGTITFSIPHFTCFMAMEDKTDFIDILNHWAREDIEIMAARQITKGTGENRFNPDAKVSRAEFTAMIVRALNITEKNDENPFRDVKTEDWFSGAAIKANAAGLIQGDAKGYFAPSSLITREEMAVIAVRAYCYYTGTHMSQLITTQEIRFKDEKKAADWARKSITLADALGLMSGFSDETFGPKNYSSRAEAIVVIKRLMKLVEIF